MRSTRGASTSLRLANPEERAAILSAFERRFGLPSDAFEPYDLLIRGRNVWVVRRSPHLPVALQLEPETVGLRLARYTNLGLKPSTFALQVFGRSASRNVARVSYEEAVRFLRGEEIHRTFDVEPGYVIVQLEDTPLGCGLYKGTGVLMSLVPKKIRLDAPRTPAP